MEIRDPEFNRFFSEALKLLSTRRRICGDFIFRGFVRVFLFSFLSFCFLSLSFFQTDFSFASESQPSSRSLSQGDACNKVLIKVGALEAEQPSASGLDNSKKYPWLGKKKLQGYWNTKANQEKYMKWLGEKLKFSKPEDWYGLTAAMIRKHKGSGVLQLKFNNSRQKMVMALVEAPDGGWKPWLFSQVPRSFWDIPENQKAYMEWLGKKLGYTKPEEWYAVTQDVINENSGGGLLAQKFRGSPSEMVMALVEAPRGGWLPWEFKGGVPHGFWDNEQNQKKYMEWLGEELEFSKPEGWYGLTKDVIEENSGGGLLAQKFRGSPSEMVMALVEAPDGGWKPWKFTNAPQGFWDNEANQKAYMKWLGEKLGISKPEDWYKLTGELIEENSGGGLVTKKFRGSPLEMVKALVEQPEGGWLPWEFKGGVPHGFWDNEANQKAYMKWLGEKLGISKPEDWYEVTANVIEENSGGTLLKKFNSSPAEMVMALVKAPEDGWKKEKFYDPSKMEGHMRKFLVRWFNGLSKPSFNDRKTHGLKFKGSSRGMEADVLFEDIKFAIEYHGEQHYAAADNRGGQEAFEKTQKRDLEKREAFKNAGYIYIEIPYDQWKDGSEVALKNLILDQLKEFEASSDPEVKARAGLIEEVLQKPTINEDDTSEAIASTNNESLPMILPFGESDLSGSESDPATSPNTASVGR